jgi:hypothetical protein
MQERRGLIFRLQQILTDLGADPLNQVPDIAEYGLVAPNGMARMDKVEHSQKDSRRR